MQRTIRFLSGFKLTKWDLAYLSITISFYIFSLLTKNELHTIIAGILIGGWLVSRPSEWVASGISSIGLYLGLSDYIIGTLSSLTAIIGEIIITILTVRIALITGNIDFLELAFLSILYSIGYNFLILGALVAFRGGKYIPLTDEVFSRELEILDWAVMAALLLAFTWILGGKLSGSERIIFLPRYATAVLPLAYIVYTASVQRMRKEMKSRILTEEKLLASIILVIIGTVCALIGGELITEGAYYFLTRGRDLISRWGSPIVVTALIIGAASALYDAFINMVFTSRGKIVTSVGNLIGSAIQLLMLLIGIVGFIVPLPLNGYAAFQLIAISLVLLFFRQAIVDDRRLEPYEGAMMFILQLFIFIIPLEVF